MQIFTFGWLLRISQPGLALSQPLAPRRQPRPRPVAKTTFHSKKQDEPHNSLAWLLLPQFFGHAVGAFKALDRPEANYGNNQTRLNLLLGPFPYAIPAGCFRGRVNRDKKGNKNRWGRFRVEKSGSARREAHRAPPMRNGALKRGDVILLRRSAARRGAS